MLAGIFKLCSKYRLEHFSIFKSYAAHCQALCTSMWSDFATGSKV